MTKLLVAIRDIIMPEVEDKTVFNYHSFRVLLATQLGCSGRTGPEIKALQRTCVDKSPGLAECPPEDLKLWEAWGRQVLNLRRFFFFI